MAFSPAKPDFKDVTSRGRVYVWFTPTCTTSDTVTVPLKRIISVEIFGRPTASFTATAGSVSGTTVVTISTITASCTGGNTPLFIYGQ